MKRRVRPEVIIPAVVLILLIAGSILIYRPRYGHIVSLAHDVVHAEESLTYALDYGEDIERAAAFLPRPLGDEADGDQRFLLQISGKLRELGVTPKSIQPKEEKRNGEYMIRSYVIEVECEYSDLTRFLAYLEDLPELVFIEHLDVKSKRLLTGGGHRANIGLRFIGH
jgi:hypothetical protein